MSTDQEIGEEGSTITDGPVELSYRHANPDDGNESVLLQFEYPDREGRACLLVDAGRGVDVDALLEPQDTLVAICLTHAHIDHYWSLPDALSEETPVITSPDTAKVLEDVLEVAEAEQGLHGGFAVLDLLHPVTEWTEVSPGVEIHPVPAGHTPGAVGFLVRFMDSDDSHDILLTGDFTLSDCAGYPGFDPSLAADVEVLFLTGATGVDPGYALTNGLGDALEAARSGGRTLVTASAFTGVQFATLLTAAATQLDLGFDLEVRLVGQTAKFYEALGYDNRRVECIPVYDDPHTCLSPGTITIAGPETPKEGSSARLFREVKHDADAALVQLITGSWPPIHAGGCASTAYEFSMHPTEETLASVVEELEPVHTVVTHRRGSPSSWNEWPSVVWGPGDADAYTLYRGGGWRMPPWMGGFRHQDTSGVTRLGSIAGGLFDQLSPPTIDRAQSVSLVAEGIDVDALRDRLSSPPAKSSTTPSPRDSPAEGTTIEGSPADNTASMSESERPTRQIENRIETIRVEQELLTDPPEGFEATLPEPTSHVNARARHNLFTESADDDDLPTERGQDDDSLPETESEHTAPEGPSTESEDVEAETTDADVADSEGDEKDSLSAPAGDGDADVASTVSPPPDAEETRTVELSPLVNGLLSQAIDADTTRAVFIADAVELYLGTLLRDGAAPLTPTDLEVSVDVPGVLQPAVDEALHPTEFDGVEAFACSALADLLDTADTSVNVALGRCESLLEAVVDGELTAFSSVDDVVEAAALWAVETGDGVDS